MIFKLNKAVQSIIGKPKNIYVPILNTAFYSKFFYKISYLLIENRHMLPALICSPPLYIRIHIF